MAEEHVDSYYGASANSSHGRESLQGDISCDVCVIGAGFTGLTVALELAEKGLDVSSGSGLVWRPISRQACHLTASSMPWIVHRPHHGVGAFSVPGRQ